jgi:hypothetical protein
MRFRLSGKIFPWKKISAVGRFLFLQDQKFQGRSVVLGISAGVPGSKVSDELAAVRRHVKNEGHGARRSLKFCEMQVHLSAST